MTREICIRFVASAAAILLALSAYADQPQRFPNSIKYKDSGVKPATGRSGSATITARALLAKDHSASLEVTTGELDATSAAPGNIDKVQVKLFAGGQTYTNNYNGLKDGGRFALTIPAMMRHGKIQIQTNVSGVDPKRTGVVTVEETAKLRPDLAVSNLQAPAQVRENVPVNLSAVVREINGDVGARSNCILSVDGSIVDQAAGIWTDAGGTVSCAFTYAFSGIGTHAVSIAAADVVPGDYDIDNNSVVANVRVIPPGQPFPAYYASAHDIDITDSVNDWSDWSEYHRAETGWSHASDMGAEAPPLRLDNVITATVRETSNGIVISEVKGFEEINVYTQPGYGAAYAWGYDSNSARWLHLVVEYDNEWGYTSISTERYSGEVTYHSHGWTLYYVSRGGDFYTWNNVGGHSWGEKLRPRFGPTVETELTLSDGVTTYSSTARVQLQPWFYQRGHPTVCADFWGWWNSYAEVCWNSLHTEVGVKGEVFEWPQ